MVGQGRSEPERFRRDAIEHMTKIDFGSLEAQAVRSEPDFDETELVAALVGVDIVASIDSVSQAIQSGAGLDRVITTLVMVAADRMARAPTAVDAGWENLTVELNVAASIRKALRYGGLSVALKGLFHVAFQIFSDRWINIPDRDLEQTLQTVDPPAKTEEAAVAEILRSVNTLDVDSVGPQVLGYLQAGFSGLRLLHDLGGVILRDDSGQDVLPTLRTVFDEWENCTSGNTELGADHPSRFQLIVGLARYATDIRSNTEDTSAAYAATRFAQGRTTVEIFE